MVLGGAEHGTTAYEIALARPQAAELTGDCFIGPVGLENRKSGGVTCAVCSEAGRLVSSDQAMVELSVQSAFE